MKRKKKHNQNEFAKKIVTNDEEFLFEEADDLGSEDEEFEEADDLGSEDEEFEEADDLGSEDEEFEEADDLGSEDEELEEADDLGLEDEELEEDASGSKSTKQILKNVGLTVSPTAQKELDEQLEEFLSTKVKAFSSVGNRGASFLSIVKADTGTSIRLTKDVTAKLNNPTRLSVGFTGAYLVLCNADELNVSSYKGSFKNARTIVYNTGLVEAIIKQFNLDFSNKTSISFSEGYYTQQGRVILYVKLG
ncbi:hypothetical protein PVN34_20300 [Bacillus thuringiensis]|uniref:hypothetical protein n=1 Tax=Bacillus thuringiensis TaxID=1428 RepID=UPI00237909E7|nr:hypothetical protein [Bacillus thuringiensis]MDD9280866.1 hypothetical protein [Bacillus thuringiensis]